MKNYNFYPLSALNSNVNDLETNKATKTEVSYKMDKWDDLDYIAPLSATATTEEAIAKINEMLAQLNGNAHAKDPALTYIKYDDGSLSALTVSGSLTSNTIPNKAEMVYAEVGNQVTAIVGESFKYSPKLKEVKLPTSVVRLDGSGFQQMNQGIAVNVPNSVSSIGGYVFSNSNNLSVTFDDRTMAEVQAMDGYYWRISGKIICTDGTISK